MTLLELIESIKDTVFILNKIGVKDSPSVRQELQRTDAFLRAYLKGTEEANKETGQ